MSRFKLTLEYVGTRYRGWQIQKNARTVQGELTRAAREATGRPDFELMGSGRTDAGVHALAQVAHLDVATTLDPHRLRMALNDALPADINVLSAARVPRRFHARHDAVGRSYLYQIARRRTAFGKPFVWWIRDALDVPAMGRAGALFVGLQDFRSFTEDDPEEKSTRVRVEALELAETESLVLVRIRGSHFVWKMVRRIVGVLAEVGRGGLAVGEVQRFLRQDSPEPARLTAPPSGLFLERVLYAGDPPVGPLRPVLDLAAPAAEPTEAQSRAEAIVKQVEAASQRELAPAFRASVVRSLAALSPEELAARETRDPARGLGLLALGDSAAQLVYTPVPPCRIIDTRVGGGQLTPGSIRDFRVTGTGSLASQGGSPTGCAVPFGPATSAVINFVAVNPSGPGNLRAWAYSSPPVPPPGASIINYTTVPGATLNLANGIMVPLCDLVLGSCPNLDLRVRADVSATQLVADVVGYFERFPKEQIRSFTIVDIQATDTLIATGCTHVTDSQVTVTVPAPGRVVVRAVAVHDIVRSAPDIDDRVLVVGIGTTPTDCAFTNYAHSKVKDDTFTETFLFTVPVTAVFEVVPGTYNYYLNAYMPVGGPSNASVYGASFLEATFYPN